MTGRKILRFAPLLAFALLVALFATPLLRGYDPSALPSALRGKPAPDFVLQAAVSGRPGFSTAELKGKLSIVNVFASWCVTCAAEQEFLTDKTEKTGLPLYGIAYKDKREDTEAWLERHGNPFTAIGADADGRVAIDWGVYGVPETYLVGPSGVVLARHAGPMTEKVWQKDFALLLREGAR